MIHMHDKCEPRSSNNYDLIDGYYWVVVPAGESNRIILAAKLGSFFFEFGTTKTWRLHEVSVINKKPIEPPIAKLCSHAETNTSE